MCSFALCSPSFSFNCLWIRYYLLWSFDFNGIELHSLHNFPLKLQFQRIILSAVHPEKRVKQKKMELFGTGKENECFKVESGCDCAVCGFVVVFNIILCYKIYLRKQFFFFVLSLLFSYIVSWMNSSSDFAHILQIRKKRA